MQHFRYQFLYDGELSSSLPKRSLPWFMSQFRLAYASSERKLPTDKKIGGKKVQRPDSIWKERQDEKIGENWLFNRSNFHIFCKRKIMTTFFLFFRFGQIIFGPSFPFRFSNNSDKISCRFAGQIRHVYCLSWVSWFRVTEIAHFENSSDFRNLRSFEGRWDCCFLPINNFL